MAWGLRDYKIEPSIWDGQEGCDHEWGTAQRIRESWGDTGILDDQKQGSNRGAKDNVAALTKPSNFCERCGGWKGQLGLEPDFRLYVRHIVEIMQAVKRVLKPTGSLYLNLGDTYSGGSGHNNDHIYLVLGDNKPTDGRRPKPRDVLPKSLIGIPERVMIAMQDDGWILRNKPIWRKNNAMPTSVKDRYANTWEAVYFFVKSNEKAYWHNDKTLQVVGKQPQGTHGEEGKDWDWGWRQIDPRRQAKKVAKLLKESPDLLFEREYEDEDPLTGEIRKYKELFAWGKVSHWRGHDYYFDLDAIRVPHKIETWGLNKDGSYRGKATKEYAGTGAQDPSEIKARMAARINPLGGNPGDVIGSDKWDTSRSKYGGTDLESGHLGTGRNRNIEVMKALGMVRSERSGALGIDLNGKDPGDVLEGPKQDAVIDPQTGEPKQTYVGFNERWKSRQRRREWTSEEALGREMGAPDPHRAASIGGLASGNAENHPGGKNPGDFWVVNTRGYPEAHFACVDSETQALTTGGWKSIDQLEDGMSIAAFDGRNLVWQEAKFERFPFRGTMIQARSRDLSMLLTPNHRVVCRDYRRKGDWKVRRADSLGGKREEIPVVAPFVGVSIPGTDTAFAELCGWVLTDGSYKHRLVVLYQTEGRGKTEQIESLFARLGIAPKIYKRRRPADKSGVEIAYSFGGEFARLIQHEFPLKEGNYELLVGWPDQKLQALWKGMTEGDGNRRNDGRVTFVGNKAKVDFYQALSLRLGMACRVSFRQGNSWSAFVSKKSSTSLRGTNSEGGVLNAVHYDGVVWCPRVESGMWLARRSGRPFITGNTFPLALVTNPIKASSPAEVCTVCGLPRVRVVKTDYQVRVDHPKGEEPKLSQNEDNKFKTMPFTGSAIHTTTGWASCSCGAPFRPGVVLDPFGGSGTVSLGAKEQGRSSVYIDIKPEYLEMAKKRVGFGVPTLDGSVTWREEHIP